MMMPLAAHCRHELDELKIDLLSKMIRRYVLAVYVAGAVALAPGRIVSRSLVRPTTPRAQLGLRSRCAGVAAAAVDDATATPPAPRAGDLDGRGLVGEPRRRRPPARACSRSVGIAASRRRRRGARARDGLLVALSASRLVLARPALRRQRRDIVRRGARQGGGRAHRLPRAARVHRHADPSVPLVLHHHRRRLLRARARVRAKAPSLGASPPPPPPPPPPRRASGTPRRRESLPLTARGGRSLRGRRGCRSRRPCSCRSARRRRRLRRRRSSARRASCTRPRSRRAR